MLKVLRAAVTPALLPFAFLGIVVIVADRRSCARGALFLVMVLAASAVALVRLHATGGYCTTRHGLVPGMLLTIVAAEGLACSTSKLTIPGRWVGLRRQPRGVSLAGVVALIVVLILTQRPRHGLPEFRSVRGLSHGRDLARPECQRWR